MPTQILLYKTIQDETADTLMREMDAAGDDDVVLRINTRGGSPELTFGLVAKFNELKGKKTVKVDGAAYSAGAFFLCYADNVDALDVSVILLHRAAYSEWYEKDYMTDDQRKNLDMVNASLRKALENKVDVAALEKISGITMDQLFAMDTRIDINLTAKEAKKIGLVDTITTITPAKQKEISALAQTCRAEIFERVAAFADPSPKTNTKMTKDQFKAEHPEAYAQIVAEATTQERERVAAFMEFADVDADGVKTAISTGAAFTAVAAAKMMKAAATITPQTKPTAEAQKAIDELQKENAAAITTPESAAKATAENAESSAYRDELYKHLKIKA
jgi:ATP-dependent Clp protease, protease subunit